MMVSRQLLTRDEWNWLVRICQHETEALPKEVESRLLETGFFNSAGPLDATRELVRKELLSERRNRLQARDR